MACINTNGEITQAARRIMTASLEPSALSRIAQETELPLYRIRSATRELAEAGYLAQSGDDWVTTGTGRDALKRVDAAV